MKTLNLFVLLFILLIAGCAQKKDYQTLPQHNMVQASNIQEQPVQPVVNSNINFPDNSVVYFDFNVSTPKTSEENKIINQINYLKTHNFKRVIIEGHTDEYGTREYNLALGEKRADAIKDIFIANGINPAKIKVVSYGKEHIYDLHNSAKNRRTVTKIEY